MCLSCFCVLRGLFRPGCYRGCTPRPPAPPQPPSAAPHLAARVGEGVSIAAEGWRSRLPPRAPHLRLHKARHSPPHGGSMRPARGAGVSGGSRLRYISGCLKSAFLSLVATGSRRVGRSIHPRTPSAITPPSAPTVYRPGVGPQPALGQTPAPGSLEVESGRDRRALSKTFQEKKRKKPLNHDKTLVRETRSVRS